MPGFSIGLQKTREIDNKDSQMSKSKLWHYRDPSNVTN